MIGLRSTIPTRTDHRANRRNNFCSKARRSDWARMFIKIFVSFPTGQHAILTTAHDKRVVGSHGIEPRDRKVPLGCFTSDHSKARSLSCILPRVSGSLVPGFLFLSLSFSLEDLSADPNTYSKVEPTRPNQPTIYISNSSSSSSISSSTATRYPKENVSTNLEKIFNLRIVVISGCQRPFIAIAICFFFGCFNIACRRYITVMT